MIYLDNVATSPLSEEVLTTYYRLLKKYFYNPDSLYDKGIEVNQLQEKSRANIADMLGVNSEEIIFTSSGSEANNLAIKGTALAYQNRGKHLITSVSEHSSVYESFKQLEEVFGFEVTYLTIDNFGQISLQELAASIRSDTILVSLMYVNNEMGTINSVEEISRIVRKHPKIKLHVDMVQALAKLPIDLSLVDLASFSAHKINGLKGSGFLYKNRKLNLIPLINGGQQEYGLRGGTENACTNIVLAKTVRLALEQAKNNKDHLKKLSYYLYRELQEIKELVINSNPDISVNNILNVSMPGYKPEVIMHYLESKNIYISTKSACSSKAANISRVLENTGLDPEVKKSSFRISLSEQTTFQDIDDLITALKNIKVELKKQR